MNKIPKYFLSVLGDPKPPDKDEVGSGIYHPDSKYYPFQPEPGDVLILYCTSSYKEYFMRVPGIGIVLAKNDTEINYRYLPLSRPIYKTEIDVKFEGDDKKKFDNRRFSSHWLFEISKNSFLNALSDRIIVWP